jgi:glycosyltransferase 2 family protein
MPPKSKLRISWLRVGYLAVAAVVMYLLVSQLSNLKGSLHELRFSRLSDDTIVFLAVCITYLLAGLTYYLIALKPLRYLRTVVIEVAVNTVNRLLPAGIGGMGANYVYLRKSDHSRIEGAAVVAVNTGLGIIANLLLLVIVVSFFGASKLKFSSSSIHLVLIGVLAVAAVAATIAAVPSWRRRVSRGLHDVINSLKLYKKLKLRLVFGVACQMGLCLAFVLAMDYSLKAVNGHLPLGSVMVAYSFAIWLGAAIPAPGGVGSVETGLAAALVAFKVDLTQAIAAVLIFRLLSFWLPLLLGIGPLIWSFKRGYL